jgi:signal transduction histidine kinase
MNGKIQYIWNLIEQSNKLPQEEKDAMLKSLKDADKEISIASFKIERLEKVKYTTTVLLEQTIEELESKRASVEKQKRELEIETALERVRARTMAMQKSEELVETSLELFQQFRNLGEVTDQITIGVMNEEENVVEISATVRGNKLPQTFKHDINEPLVMNKVYQGWKAQQRSLVIELKGKDLIAYNQYRNALVGSEMFSVNLDNNDRKIVYVAYYSKGMLALSAQEPRPAETIHLLERLAGAFDLTYTRFLDLKNAEAQAREAQIEAALERVRSRTMGMQKSDELKETIQLLYDQMVQLGLFVEHAGFIIDWSDTEYTIWLADKHVLPFKATIPYFDCAHLRSFNEARRNGTTFFTNLYSFEEKNKFYNDLFELLPGVPQETKDYYQACAGLAISTVLLDNVGLYIENFSGIPYTDEENRILKRFGKVFQQSYTRFLDLQKAEEQTLQAEQDLIEIKAARKKAEDALIELQATQKQLIQSEKMASLGELTAGIAHEIQNPLNFVNNFAEINTELVDELKTELEKGNIDEVKFIASDLKDNNDKIAFHGKRAESIVKGMLQHSRTSTGKKELADINALADEFLRLSYHGLRAKDKSFNATMETSFDYNIEKVEIIPQDIGRVLLNLFNNAFYSVNEKKKMLNGLYEPKVFVSTEKSDGKIAIVVKDNGNGIPQKIIDKIYHPFFTTKPTGEGTGLGLSLSYDIITKGHNGELKVETKEGEFASFKIILPA